MEKMNPPKPGEGHGRLERGLDETSRSRLHVGRFGRMFRSLPPAIFDDTALRRLAHEGHMTSPPEKDPVTKLPRATPETATPPDDEENFGIPAGYTYFGQFVDHDLTFDPVTGSVKLDDPDGLINFRTPALDLDSLYGRGPSDVPYMYDGTGRKFLLGDRFLTGAIGLEPVKDLVPDLPRFHGRAIIGDKRNDENVIVSQLHGLFQRFHNHLADTLTNAAGQPLSFVEVQRLVRWHYQWLVLFDYLPRIVGHDMVKAILPHIIDNSNINDNPPKIHFYTYRNNPFMPVEFSGAAYRFGHSMVRPMYRLSAVDFHSPGLDKVDGLGGRKVVFAANADDGLNGFHAFDAANGIDWRLYFDTRTHKLSPTLAGKGRVQPAYKMDTSLVNPLGFLPEFSNPGTDHPIGALATNNLAFRNLKRGVNLELPSGQAIARLMGLDPIPDERLLVGKANTGGLEPRPHHKSGVANKSIIDIDEQFADNAPLWFYILAEALDGWRQKADLMPTEDKKNAQTTHLGPVGGRIVAEVLIGLILGDNDSFLSMNPNWKPMFGDPGAETFFERFTMGDLIELVPNQ